MPAGNFFKSNQKPSNRLEVQKEEKGGFFFLEKGRDRIGGVGGRRGMRRPQTDPPLSLKNQICQQLDGGQAALVSGQWAERRGG